LREQVIDTLEGLVDTEVKAIINQREALRARIGRIRAAVESDADLKKLGAVRDFLLAETDIGPESLIGHVPAPDGCRQARIERLTERVMQRFLPSDAVWDVGGGRPAINWPEVVGQILHYADLAPDGPASSEAEWGEPVNPEPRVEGGERTDGPASPVLGDEERERPSYEVNERHAFMAGAEFLRDSIRVGGRGRNRVWSHAGMTQVIEAADEYLEGKR
jgi:hypothetical protein